MFGETTNLKVRGGRGVGKERERERTTKAKHRYLNLHFNYPTVESCIQTFQSKGEGEKTGIFHTSHFPKKNYVCVCVCSVCMQERKGEIFKDSFGLHTNPGASKSVIFKRWVL